MHLARDGMVLEEKSTDKERVFRVKVPGKSVAATVVLYIEDTEWDCDCNEKNACSHVPAAIVSAQAPLPEKPKTTKVKGIGYRVYSKGEHLELRRVSLLPRKKEAPLVGRMSTIEGYAPNKADHALDRIMSGRQKIIVSTPILKTVLSHLASVADLKFNDETAKASADEVLPIATISDGEDDGVELRIENDPEVTEAVANGVALCGDTLRPLACIEFTGPKLEATPFSRNFPGEELGTVVTDLMPALEEKLEVDIKTDRLPGVNRSLRPRIAIDIFHEGEVLSILPTLVYGDPPVARIDAGELVHLGGSLPVRDPAAERRLVFQLRDELNLVPGKKIEVTGRDALNLAQRLAEWKNALTTSGQALFQPMDLDPQVEIDGDNFDVIFATQGGLHANPAQVIRAWRAGENLVPVEGAGWAPIPTEFLNRAGDLIADLLGARDEGKKVPTFAIPDLSRLAAELDFPPPPGLDKLTPIIEEFDGIPDAKLPKDLTADLRDYQIEGVNWLYFLRDSGLGGVLADDMGLGKTVQALCAVNGRTLVVCPTSVLHNWKKEANKFRPSLKVCIFHGPSRKMDDEADIVLTTYSLLRGDSKTLQPIHWDAVILDEAQFIKNPDSQVAQAAYKLEANFRLTLTGTPVENRLDELWSQFHFCNRGLLGGRSDFRERYSRPIEEGNKEYAGRLRKRIQPFVLRRLKKEVASELPPRTSNVLYCELTEEERGLYNSIRAATQADIVKLLSKKGNVMAALEALLRLRQASCHPSLVPEQKAETSSKVDVLMSLLDEANSNGHKVLVFSQWTSFLNLVEPHLEKNEIAYDRLDGATKNRQEIVDKFQSPDGPPVLLLSLKAGGTGLNLTAADHVVLLDPWWNPAVEDQAADRTHRIGQTKPVFVYRIVARDTVEERILKLQEKKRALFDAALGDAAAAARVTKEDLLELLS